MTQIKLYKNMRKLIIQLLLVNSIFVVLFFWADKGIWHWVGIIGAILMSAFIVAISIDRKPLIIVSERGIRHFVSNLELTEWGKIKDAFVIKTQGHNSLKLVLESTDEVEISLEQVKINELHLKELIVKMLQAENTSKRKKLIDKFWKNKKESE